MLLFKNSVSKRGQKEEVNESRRSRDLFLFRGSETVLQSLAPGQMAHQENPLDRERFCYSICLDLLKDPVTIGCGHSYCMSCITTHWDNEGERGIYICPQCRQTFTRRPVLSWFVWPLIVEKHLQPHFQSPPFKKQKMVETSEKLQDICSRHNEVMKTFCRTDQRCICHLCPVDDHKAAAERTERQREQSSRESRTERKMCSCFNRRWRPSMALLVKQWRPVRRSSLSRSAWWRKRTSDVKQQIR